jgi:hypothetical protein
MLEKRKSNSYQKIEQKCVAAVPTRAQVRIMVCGCRNRTKWVWVREQKKKVCGSALEAWCTSAKAIFQNNPPIIEQN